MVRQVKRLACVLGATLAAACALAGPAAAYEPRVTDEFFGVSAPELWALTAQNKDAQRDAQLNQMKAAGIDWARVELGWPEIEPNAPSAGVHTYQWAAADRLVSALAARGMELLAIPMATPGWAATPRAAAGGCGRRSELAASRAADYAAFAEAIVRRYGASGSFWAARPDLPKVPVRRIEIWNEPNYGGFWCPEPNPEVYAAALRGAAERIHAADPGAQVIVGGFAALQDSKHEGDGVAGLSVDTFLRRALAAEPTLRDAIDVVGFHPYDLDPSVNLSLIGGLRRTLVDVGLAEAGIALTEFGWRTGSFLDGITELLRTSNYQEMANKLPRTDCGLTAVAAHTWQTPELNLLDPNHWWGLVSPLTGLLHPSGEAYRDQIALFEGRGPTPAPRSVIEICSAPAPPDQDSDGTPDEEDDFPTDPEQDSGSGEVPPPPPEEEPVEPRLHPQRAEGSFFGATIVQLPDDFARLDEEFAAMSSARIGVGRMRIDWSYVEPVPPSDPSYDRRSRWNWLDRIVLRMALEGIRLTPAFGALPGWAPGSGSAFNTQYASFVGRFAARYGRNGSFWAENGHLDEDALAVRDLEAWQYGNVPAHAPDGTTSAVEYADTYLGVRAVVKTLDPGANAVLSLDELGVGGRAGDFVRAMVAARPALRGGIDAAYVLAEHSDTADQVDAAVRDVRLALEDTGNAAAPIYLGFGAPVRGPGAISESERAALFTEVATRAALGDCGVRALYPHAWSTPELDEVNPWNWYGIASKADATLSATAIAYRDLAALLGGYLSAAPPTTAVHPCNSVAPDSDGDGTPDPLDPAPLDPSESTPIGAPPPAPTIGGGPSSPTVSRAATFTLTAGGATSFQCRLDDARSFSPCGASPSYANLAHGDHVLRARAVDSKGVVGPESTHRWTVDIVGPNMAEVTGPGPISLSSTLRFDFRADEPSASVACRFDGRQWEFCTSPKTYTGIGDGAHEFRVAAIDTLGNIGPITLKNVEVRTTPGAASITSGPSGATDDPRPQFGFAAQYAASFDCRFDGGTWAACSGASTHQPSTPLAAGAHTFEVRAVGGTGVRGPAATREFSFAPAGPALKILTLKSKPRVSVFAFEVDDPSGQAALTCQLDGKAWRACGSPHKLRNLTRGRHVLRARATDPFGNVAEAAARWRVRR